FGKVYFPAGKWYDLFNGDVQQGGQEKIVQLNINKLPVYVKAGSIIPVQSLVQTTSQLPTDTLTLHVYEGDTANSFVYYEDDGKSYDYEKGNFYKRVIKFDPTEKTISLNKAAGSYKTHFKFIKLILHSFQSAAITRGNQKISLTSGRYGWLSAAANTDPTGGAYTPETCPVKQAVLKNEDGVINIKY
ncbi:MAG: DUF5110 domain-containing protein, partial [Sphingobacteriaceae bacterium]